MRKSARLVSVVISYLALLGGLLALPTAGQGGSLSVLNWIPPTSLAGKTPCDFFTTLPATKPPTPVTCPTTSTANVTEVTGIIPMWLSSDTSNSVVYNFAMVGKNPMVTGSGGTQIDTKIIPIVFTGSASGVSYIFDPENNDACSPKRTPALNMVQQSPLFKAGTLQLQKALGSGQFGSLFQRANFWTYTQPKAASPNYQITLNQVLANAEENRAHRIAIIPAPPATNPPSTTLPYSINGVVQTDSTWCAPLAMIDVNELDTLLQTQIIPALKGTSGVSPTTLPIFLFSNVVMSYTVIDTVPTPNTSTTYCCILGYHNAYPSATTGATQGKLQTYIVANYDTTSGSNFPGAFPNAPDLVALSNMIAGWIDNPTTLNTTPPWTGTINGVPGCQSTLEVAYPDAVVGKLAPITMPNKTIYHVQDLAFKSWFYGDTGSDNSGFGGNYSLSLSLNSTALTSPNPGCP